jgi:hypothetical protein
MLLSNAVLALRIMKIIQRIGVPFIRVLKVGPT